jgi:hypothetical protein
MMIDSTAARWYHLISEAETVWASTGLGLASAWEHINADDYPAARRGDGPSAVRTPKPNNTTQEAQ